MNCLDPPPNTGLAWAGALSHAPKGGVSAAGCRLPVLALPMKAVASRVDPYRHRLGYVAVQLYSLLAFLRWRCFLGGRHTHTGWTRTGHVFRTWTSGGGGDFSPSPSASGEGLAVQLKAKTGVRWPMSSEATTLMENWFPGKKKSHIAFIHSARARPPGGAGRGGPGGGGPFFRCRKNDVGRGGDGGVGGGVALAILLLPTKEQSRQEMQFSHFLLTFLCHYPSGLHPLNELSYTT